VTVVLKKIVNSVAQEPDMPLMISRAPNGLAKIIILFVCKQYLVTSSLVAVQIK
jgi:hypothetical protein